MCAGLADYTGWDVSFFRLLFSLSMLFGGVGFGIYMILWVVIPAAQEMTMPKVSWSMQWTLRQIRRRVQKVNRKHDPFIGDMAREAFEAVQLMAGSFESGKDAAIDPALKALALNRFPRLLDDLLRLPAQAMMSRTHEDRSAPGRVVLDQLTDYRRQLQQAAQLYAERHFRSSLRQDGTDSPELMAWRGRLEPLRQRLAERSQPETVGLLSAIEDKLGFLLRRLDQGRSEVLDLRPFEVRKIAFEYLPDTLNEYLRLPSSMASTERIAGQQTAEAALNEQLTLLDTTLHDLAKSLFEQDAAGLLVHGRFLKEKFAEKPFHLDLNTEEYPPS